MSQVLSNSIQNGFIGLCVLSVQVVQVNTSNLDCWGVGESVYIHVVKVFEQKDEVTSTYPQCPCGPESNQITKSWVQGSL